MTVTDLADNEMEKDLVSIEALVADSHVTLRSLVEGGLLTIDDFENHVFEQAGLEAEPLFVDGQFDDIVHVGTVAIGDLLGSILFDRTLDEYAGAGFIDRFDFDNIALDVSAIEAAFTVDVDDGFGVSVTL